MPAPVSAETVGNIAVVTVDRPPVNAISAEVRAGLLDAVSAADGDDAVAAIVLICAGRTFMAGADITEFDTGIADPHYHDVYDRIEAATKPVVAALHGTALGGGLEAALACHYRIAVPDARMGLPEVTLGIIPGAGGTQRLPRLIGACAATELMLTGTPMGARDAAAAGLVDRIADGDLRDAALAYATELVDGGAGPRPTGARDVDATGFDDDWLAATRARHARRLRGQHAPDLIVASVRNAIALPLADGLAREREIIGAAIGTDEAKALRHIFFAERAVARVPGVTPDVARRPVERVAVLGAGTMGTGIAIALADAGLEVAIADPAAGALARSRETMTRTYRRHVDQGRLSQQAMDARLGRITDADDDRGLADADLIIEAVFEDMALKKEVFASLDAVARPGAILATNTSTLDINDIAAVTSRPDSVIGLHFFSPANIMRLLEIVRADRTAPDVLATAVDLGRRIRKVAVTVGIGSRFGFVGNRMLFYGYGREADRMALEGASPAQIDRAIHDFGFAMGPCAMNDLAGIDVMGKVLETTGARASNRPTFYAAGLALYDAGRYGQKTGAGFYRYAAGDRAPHPDADAEDLLAAAAGRLGVARRELADDEIVERCVYALVNEGARCLAEGIAARPGDIDAIWVHGYGFPRWRGGPMRYADAVGLAAVHAGIVACHERFGDDWEPAPLLAELAADGRTFADWSAASAPAD